MMEMTKNVQPHRKGGGLMATSTFDRTFIVSDKSDQERIYRVMNSDKPAAPIKNPPYTQEERDRSAELLRQCLSRSGN